MQKRWTASRKAGIVKGILLDTSNFQKAIDEHNLTPIELGSWCQRYCTHGLEGLKTTKLFSVRKRHIA